MSDISNIHNVGSVYPVNRPITPDGAATSIRPAVPSHPPFDTVEFSPRATALARVAEESSLRIARTNAFRTQIENGTFETPERIEGTITQLLDIIG